MREYWVSAYTQDGQQFSDSIEADNVDELFTIFHSNHPDCEIADYGEYEDDVEITAADLHDYMYGI